MARDASENGSELLLLAFVGGAVALLSGCGGGAGAPVQNELALTTADENQLAPNLRTLYSTLLRIAEPMRERQRRESEPLRLRVATTNGEESLVFQLVRNGAGDYPHLRVYRPRTGEHANFVFGGSLSQGITLRLTDDQGRVLQRDGERLEFSLFDTRQRTRAPQDWIEQGIRIAALAFVVWLGAVLVRGIAAAVGFVAFNLIILGLLAVAAGVTLPILRWIVEQTGLDWESVRRFIEQTAQTIATLLRDIVNWLTQQRL
jgi:hypothetical protein